jgi:hypothetical protein
MSPAAVAPHSDANGRARSAATPATNKLRSARSYEFRGRTAQARRNEADIFNAWVRIARSGTPPTEATLAALTGRCRRFVRTILKRLDRNGSGPLTRDKPIYLNNRLQHVPRTAHWERLRATNRSGPVPANHSGRNAFRSKSFKNHPADDGCRPETAKPKPRPELPAVAPKDAAKRRLVAQHAGKVTVQEIETALSNIAERAAAAGTKVRTAAYFIASFPAELEDLPAPPRDSRFYGVRRPPVAI